jgi:hypothetical protein
MSQKLIADHAIVIYRYHAIPFTTTNSAFLLMWKTAVCDKGHYRTLRVWNKFHQPSDHLFVISRLFVLFSAPAAVQLLQHCRPNFRKNPLSKKSPGTYAWQRILFSVNKAAQDVLVREFKCRLSRRDKGVER